MPLLISVYRPSVSGEAYPAQVMTYEKIAGGATSAVIDAELRAVRVKVHNTETAAGRIAWGTTPDATAASSTSVTTAGFPIGPNESQHLVLDGGQKINFATTT